MSDARILPAAVYDALKASAEQFGGIGASADRDDEGNPLCAFGHMAVGGDYGPGSIDWTATMHRELAMQEVLDALDNDRAVERINRRKDEAPDARVSFDEWCAELHVVRGE